MDETEAQKSARLARINRIVRGVALYWEMDTSDRERCVIKTRDDLSWWRRANLRFLKRFTMKKLYFWAMNEYRRGPHKLNIFHPFDHDNLDMSREIERIVSRSYQMLDPWVLRETDRRYLVRGPLISADGERLLVPAHGKVVGFLSMLEPYRAWITFAFGLIVFLAVGLPNIIGG